MSAVRTAEDAVDGVAELLTARIGLRSEQTVRARLRRCVRDEAAEQGLDLPSYLDTVAAGGPVFESLLDRVTVQETGFFRHPEQFDALVGAVLPALPAPVRLWSAGCANGQEAYSLAMIMEERGLAGSVVASDLSPAALARTAAGRYTARELTGLSPQRVARHLTRSGGDWEVGRSLRERVTVLRHNLVDPLPEQVRSCQVVFCRNVLIYLTQAHARAFLQRVADAVDPAALFLGSAEAIWPVTDRFEAVRVGDAFVHRPAAPVRPGSGRPPVRRPAGRRGTVVPTAGHRPAGRRLGPDRPVAPPAVPGDDTAATTALARTGEQALGAGDPRSAVVSFRKWAYLAPGDPLAQLHLGLALEAAGDRPAARRAYAVARRLVLDCDPADIERVTEGYARDELLRLVQDKERGLGA